MFDLNKVIMIFKTVTGCDGCDNRWSPAGGALHTSLKPSDSFKPRYRKNTADPSDCLRLKHLPNKSKWTLLIIPHLFIMKRITRCDVD